MKEAERLAERLEKRIEYPTQDRNSTVMWLDKDGKQWTANTGKITQLVNPDGPEAAALIRQQSTLIAALEWRPISTWPGTDEAYALVCNAGSVYPIIAGYDSNDEEWFSFNGYYEKFGKGPLVPDYWMPLPIPPATEALGKGSE